MRFDHPVFHSASPKHYLNPVPQFQNNSKYSLYFVSLIAPNFCSPEQGSTLRIRVADSAKLPRTVRLKRSYLLLAWFAYLLDEGPGVGSRRLSKLTILPARRSLYTFQKAPMAHKTNSKEQFMFKFYSFKFSTRATTPVGTVPSSVNEGLAAFYLLRRLFPAFGTNLLLLKYYQVSLAYRDSRYFSLFDFSNSRLI